MTWVEWKIDRSENPPVGELVGPCGCRYPNTLEGTKLSQKHKHPEGRTLMEPTEAQLATLYSHWDIGDAIARCDKCWPVWMKLTLEQRTEIMDTYEVDRKNRGL